MTSALPIACTLTSEAHAARLSWIADLNRRFLRAHRRHELVLTLTYASDAALLLRQLVAREGECCAFLDLTVSSVAEEIILRVEAPENARTGAAEMFAPFLSGAPES